MIRNILLALLLASFLSACWKFGRRPEPRESVMGYRPVYSNDLSLLNVTAEAPKPVTKAGKIYVLGDFIFQNELGEGIHVLDKTDPNKVKNIGFIKILGNTEMSIKGTFLYANSYFDLVVVDISNWENPTEVKRVKNAFFGATMRNYQSAIPVPEKNAYAVCVNPTLGIQTGWKKDTVHFSDCYFFNP
ncbi:hypothetical protein [Flavisolibacter tropicus]|uniref:hypothetical protein n=1 Tax=Flavisolibacter tropicus TaxID=1492898 RepID=UPI000836B657|nr:hypothetical protein [Flavisolibacter tropicus]